MKFAILITTCVILFCVLLGGCQAGRPPLNYSGSNSTPKMESDIIGAVFDYQLKQTPLGNSYQYYFLAIGDDQDPKDALMERMKRLGYSVKKLSQATFDNQGRVVDRETGSFGIIAKVYKVSLKTESEAEVSGSLKSDGDNHFGFVYFVFREDDSWKVKRHKSSFIT